MPLCARATTRRYLPRPHASILGTAPPVASVPAASVYHAVAQAMHLVRLID